MIMNSDPTIPHPARPTGATPSPHLRIAVSPPDPGPVKRRSEGCVIVCVAISRDVSSNSTVINSSLRNARASNFSAPDYRLSRFLQQV
jgi:hypothetical protein